jgi:proton-dependent oligopeptide transporter, POT family
MTSKTAPTFFGQPRALLYLSFTEAWERFSYYGMSGLLVLYMIDQLLLPGHVEHVVGFAGFRAGLESLTGPLSNQAIASQVFGLYTGFMYFTPVLGGQLADRWLGPRRTVIIGALLMSAGHVAMAFDSSFLLALALLVAGCGCLKGNISAQVGELYQGRTEAECTRGFAIFSMAINFGAVAGPIACGWLAQVYGWHIGFGAAAALMLLALVTYIAGYRYFPVDGPHRHRSAAAGANSPALTPRDRKIVATLALVMSLTIFHSVAYFQVGNAALVWIDAHVRNDVAGFIVPTAWYNSVDPLFSILGVPALFWLWRRQAAGRGEPSDVMKMAQGAALAAASNLVLVAAALVTPEGGRVSMLWPLAYCVGLGIAFLYYWPPLLALVARAAPPRVNATMMGVAFLSMFIANIMVGVLGGLYESLGPTSFWALHAAIGAAGAVLLFVLARRITRILA